MRTSTKSCFKRSKARALSSAPPAAEASHPSATPKTLGRPLLPGPSSSGHWDHSHYPQKRRCLLRKQKTAPQCVVAPTPKAVAKKPEPRGNPTRPQPTKNQVYPKTWSPRFSPKQRRSWASAKPAYLAPLKENRFYPLAYITGEKPTLH
ncbi:hypothetical protein AAC387_Pa09g0899 [Persea americana]